MERIELTVNSRPDPFSSGSSIEIMAKVTNRPTDYTVGRFLSTPPVKGISSTNIIRVRRIQ